MAPAQARRDPGRVQDVWTELTVVGIARVLAVCADAAVGGPRLGSGSAVVVFDVLGDALAVAESRTWSALAWPWLGHLGLTVGVQRVV